MVKNSHVVLLAPEVLKSEWRKHGEEEKKIILKSFKEDEKEVKRKLLFKELSAEFQKEKIEDAKRKLLSQIDVIDDLLDKHGIHIVTSDELKLSILEHRKQNKRPFGISKKDNFNDAEIIFTALDYLQKNNEAVLYFVSDNPGEFASGVEPNLILHSDITNIFPTITSYYFTHIHHAYKVFDDLKIPRYTLEINLDKITNTISIDRTKPVLDQVHEYFTKRSEQLKTIPKKILIEHYPITISESFKFHHKPFTLVTDNKALFDLLTQIEINGDEVSYSTNNFIKNKVDEEKAKGIFRFLRFNYLEKVGFEEKDGVVIKYTEMAQQCNCTLCLYNKLHLSDSLKIISEAPNSQESLDLKMKHAYMQYKLGNFIEAASEFKKLYDERKHQKDISTYIICFNLNNLREILKHHYWKDNIAKELSEELKQIDLEKIYKDCETYENKSLIDWIHEKKFYKETFANMHVKVQSITDHYYGQSSGFNDNTSNLMEYYLSTDNFLNRNYLIYDIYLEFDSLTSLFTEGLLASYGCSEFLGGKLRYFTDLVLNKLMVFGDAENIKKYYHRYKLKNISYLYAGEEGNSFTDLADSILQDYPLLKINYIKYVKNGSDYFWDNYSEIIYNLLTLLAIVSFDAGFMNRFGEKLLVFLAEKHHLHRHTLLKHLKFFLWEKRNAVSSILLRKYFILTLQNDFFHTDDFIELIVNILQEKKIVVSLTASEFEFIKKGFLCDSNSNSGTQTWLSVGDIYSVIKDSVHLNEMKTFAIKSLENEFEPDKYYLANMFEIIPPRNDFTNLYVEHIEKIILKGQQGRIFGKRDYYNDSRIDNFFNFCFKYNLEIPETIKNNLSEMGAYYIWLSNMDGFNYTDFNLSWLHNHFTIYFKRKFRQSIGLKHHLLNLIKKDSNTEIEKLFILTYFYDD